jgi:hypothetical protein
MTPNAKVANKNMSGLDGLGWPNPEDEPKPTTMNTDTPTPETDSAYIQCPNEGAWDFRIRQEKTMAKLERERDEARGQIEANHKAALVIERMVYEAREQRDRLAEALRKLADCDWVITLPNRMDAVRTIARETLQSLTP